MNYHNLSTEEFIDARMQVKYNKAKAASMADPVYNGVKEFLKEKYSDDELNNLINADNQNRDVLLSSALGQEYFDVLKSHKKEVAVALRDYEVKKAEQDTVISRIELDKLKVEQAKKGLEEKEKKLKKTEDDVLYYSKAISEAESDVIRIRAAMESGRGDYQDTQRRIAEAEDILTRTKANRDRAEESLSILRTDVKEIKTEIRFLRTDLDASYKEKSEIDKEVKRLRDIYDAKNATQERFKSYGDTAVYNYENYQISLSDDKVKSDLVDIKRIETESLDSKEIKSDLLEKVKRKDKKTKDGISDEIYRDKKEWDSTIIGSGINPSVSTPGYVKVADKEKIKEVRGRKNSESMNRALYHKKYRKEKRSKKKIESTFSERISPDYVFIGDAAGGMYRVAKDDWAAMNQKEKDAYLERLQKSHGFDDKIYKNDNKDRSGAVQSVTDFKKEHASVRKYYSEKLDIAAKNFAEAAGREAIQLLTADIQQEQTVQAAKKIRKYYLIGAAVVMAPTDLLSLAEKKLEDTRLDYLMSEAAKRNVRFSDDMSFDQFREIEEAAGNYINKGYKATGVKELTPQQKRLIDRLKQKQSVQDMLINTGTIPKDAVDVFQKVGFWRVDNAKDVQYLTEQISTALLRSGDNLPKNISQLSIGELEKMCQQKGISEEQKCGLKELIHLKEKGKKFADFKKKARIRLRRITNAAVATFRDSEYAQGFRYTFIGGKTVFSVARASLAVTRVALQTGVRVGSDTAKDLEKIREKRSKRLTEKYEDNIKKAKVSGNTDKQKKYEKKSENLNKRKERVQKAKQKRASKKSKTAAKKTKTISQKAKRRVKKRVPKRKAAKTVAKKTGKAAASSVSKVFSKAGAYVAAGVSIFLAAWICIVMMFGIFKDISTTFLSIFWVDRSQKVVSAAVSRINSLEDDFQNTLSGLSSSKPSTKGYDGTELASYDGIHKYYWNGSFGLLSENKQNVIRYRGDITYASQLTNGRQIMSLAAVYWLNSFRDTSKSTLRDFSENIWKASHLYKTKEGTLHPCPDADCVTKTYYCNTDISTVTNIYTVSSDTRDTMLQYRNHGISGGCLLTTHNTEITRTSSLIIGSHVDVAAVTQEITAGSGSYAGAKFGTSYYTLDSDGNPITIKVNSACEGYTIGYCSGNSSCNNKISVNGGTVTYYQCLGHQKKNGTIFFHGHTVEVDSETFEHCNTYACSSSIAVASTVKPVNACGGHVTCPGHHSCPGHEIHCCNGHVGLDVDVMIFNMDELFEVCKAICTPSDYGRQSGFVYNLEQRGYIGYDGKRFKGTDWLNFDKLFQPGVRNQREVFMEKTGGWNESVYEWANNIAKQDWKVQYDVTFKYEYFGTPFSDQAISALITAATTDIGVKATAAQKDAARKALSLVGKVRYYWYGERDRITKGYDSLWGAMVRENYAGSTHFEVGTNYRYGVDEIGFIRWVVYNSYGFDILEYASDIKELADTEYKGVPVLIKRADFSEAVLGDIYTDINGNNPGIYIACSSAESIAVVRSKYDTDVNLSGVNYIHSEPISKVKHVYAINPEFLSVISQG